MSLLGRPPVARLLARGMQGLLALAAGRLVRDDEGSPSKKSPRAAGALREYHDVPQADHGYDQHHLDKARASYELIARQINNAVAVAR